MSSFKKKLILFITCLHFLFWIAVPHKGGHYFYDEDEGHHYNRVLNMMKSGDFNPHYFLKPSLHFYARLPVAASSFLWEVKKQNARNLDDIKTKDPHGLGGYLMSASHPRMLFIQRAYSGAIGSFGFLSALLMATLMGVSTLTLLVIGLCYMASPLGILYGTTVGVDVFAMAFCSITSYISFLYSVQKRSFWVICLSALFAGLSVSSKYNMVPIVIVPLLAFIFSNRCLSTSTLCKFFVLCALICAGFLVATPYIFSELPLFLNHVAYELWHYNVAGHTEIGQNNEVINHTVAPGVTHIVEMLKTMTKSSYGFSLTIAGFIGILGGILSFNKKYLLLASFPLAYFVFMSMQKTFFARNLLPLLPFLAVFTGLSLEFLKKRTLAIFVIASLFSVVASAKVFTVYIKDIYSTQTDSRILVKDFIKENSKTYPDILLDSRLQFDYETLNLQNVTVIDLNKISTEDVFASGYSLVVTGDEKFSSEGAFKLLQTLGTSLYTERILRNPTIYIYDYNSTKQTNHIEKYSPLNCKNLAVEGHCWANSRFVAIDTNIEDKPTRFEVMSPWEEQEVEISCNNRQAKTIHIAKANTWITLESPCSSTNEKNMFFLKIKKIHSPRVVLGTSDSRRLAVAIRLTKNLTVD
jgi:hypothetical protein